jgi:hypothetical protein
VSHGVIAPSVFVAGLAHGLELGVDLGDKAQYRFI